MREKKPLKNRKVKAVGGVAIVLVLSAALLLSILKPFRTYDYVVLGDSISDGLVGGYAQAYPHLFYQYLQTQLPSVPVTEHELSVSGASLYDLLRTAHMDYGAMEQIKEAEVITISIGGNDVVWPIYKLFSTVFDIQLVGNSSFESDLAQALMRLDDPEQVLADIVQSPEYVEAHAQAVAQFQGNWNVLIDRIRQLSPDSVILVNSLFNPLEKNSFLFSVVEPFVEEMNKVVGQTNPRYHVVDLNTSFAADAYVEGYLNCTPESNFDPHPTVRGQEKIAELLIDVWNAIPAEKHK